MSKYTFNGIYFKLTDNSTEFKCDWCECNEFHLRGAFLVNLCKTCEGLAVDNNNKCCEVNEVIRNEVMEIDKSKLKNTVIHSPEYYEEKLNGIEYSQYLKEKEQSNLRNKKKLINPVILKHNAKKK